MARDAFGSRSESRKRDNGSRPDKHCGRVDNESRSDQPSAGALTSAGDVRPVRLPSVPGLTSIEVAMCVSGDGDGIGSGRWLLRIPESGPEAGDELFLLLLG